ncbi:tRNA pseudouridine38-40 synthase [Nonlabens sp. Hel1_33_55]|uniref:tRNA pseudouridine(38-40) synthase TruA n=1 Tax=Nonlabens sp. Hel1_33_55 TaxID=1336802 RepID=UPI000875B02F|nr:tRNA pseudouridine(38-40) synthase TruA [Nonlabens sp. Hel1_33_55]SCX87988.1 tRNA pseudouridine38-40 synthase [Nonlabens sp. Hel1_33_55]
MQKQRYFIELAYDGTVYHGWQRQPQSISVQEVLEDGLSKMLHTKMYVTGAGRTDAGVHAAQMFAHFDYEDEIDTIQLAYRLNRWIAKDISIFEIKKVTDKAHARFSATHRSYEYRFNLRPDAFKNRSTYVLYRIPDIEHMQQAADILLEYTDFECFSRTNTDVKTYLCDVSEARFEHKDFELIFHITANRFLRNMVRAVVGTLLQVGYGKLEVEDMHRIIASKDRGEAGASAPAQGLYLTRVRYPDEIWINE